MVKMRKEALQAAELLAKNLRGKQPLEVALQEALAFPKETPPAIQRLALVCSSALDDFSQPLDMLNGEQTTSDLRQTAIFILRHWMAQGRDNEYEIYDALTKQKRYSKVVARKLMERLHGVSQKDAANPATWQWLIDDLNNPELLLRELSAWNLANRNVPGSKDLVAGYTATLPEPQRRAIQNAWRNLIPPGQLPPAGAPMKK